MATGTSVTGVAGVAGLDGVSGVVGTAGLDGVDGVAADAGVAVPALPPSPPLQPDNATDMARNIIASHALEILKAFISRTPKNDHMKFRYRRAESDWQ